MEDWLDETNEVETDAIIEMVKVKQKELRDKYGDKAGKVGWSLSQLTTLSAAVSAMNPDLGRALVICIGNLIDGFDEEVAAKAPFIMREMKDFDKMLKDRVVASRKEAGKAMESTKG